MKKERISWFFAIFLLGFLAGACAILLFTGQELDRLHITINELQGELEDKEKQLSILQEQVATKKQDLVEKTALHVILSDENWANHQAIREALERNIKNILAPVLGQPVNEVKPEVVLALLNQRIIHTEYGQFILKIDWLVIATTLETQVSARLY